MRDASVSFFVEMAITAVQLRRISVGTLDSFGWVSPYESRSFETSEEGSVSVNLSLALISSPARSSCSIGGTISMPSAPVFTLVPRQRLLCFFISHRAWHSSPWLIVFLSIFGMVTLAPFRGARRQQVPFLCVSRVHTSSFHQRAVKHICTGYYCIRITIKRQ